MKRSICLVLLLVLQAGAVTISGDARGGNCFTRFTLSPTQSSTNNLISIPLTGYEITGSETNALHINDAFPVRSYPDGTLLYFYNGRQYIAYEKDFVTEKWVQQRIVDLDNGVLTNTEPVEEVTRRQGMAVWIQLPAIPSSSDTLRVFGQLSTKTFVQQTFAGPTDATHPSYNLVGFGSLQPIVLHGEAQSGEQKAVWNFPAVTGTSLTRLNGKYQLIVPGSDGIDRRYIVINAGYWRTLSSTDDVGRVVLPAGRGFWFINPSSTVPSVTVEEVP